MEREGAWKKREETRKWEASKRGNIEGWALEVLDFSDSPRTGL